MRHSKNFGVFIVLTSSLLAPLSAQMPAAQAQAAPFPFFSSDNSGRIGRIALQLRDFDYGGMRLELGEIEFNDVTYRVPETNVRGDKKKDRTTQNNANPKAGAGPKANVTAPDAIAQGPIEITGAGLSKAHFIVGAASLEKMMQGRIKDVSDLRLSLKNDRIHITGTRPAPFIGIPLPFVLDGKLEARNGDQLWLSDTQLSLGGAALPENVVRDILGTVNPIYTVDFTRQWNFRTVIKTIVTRNEKLDISGDLVFTPPTNTAAITPKPTGR